MFRELGRLFAKGEVPPDFTDPLLGRFVFNRDNRWWETQALLGGQPVTFVIGGNEQPDPGLLNHARDIFARFAEIDTRVRAFLDREAQSPKLRGAVAEISNLRIESINLLWPKRPNDGMIFFAGSSNDRIWRCDYVGREPQGLGFDN